jgi:hypothetical protein
MQILQGQLAVVQLAVRENLVYQILYKTLDSGWRRIGQRSRRRFNRVCQHDQSGFPGLRLWPGISVVIDIHRIPTFQQLGFFIKIPDKAGSV